MTTYTTSQGDTFDLIAYNILGDVVYTDDLMRANPNYITTVIFSAGIVLNIPDITQSTTTTVILPPWKTSS